ncbi:hypothetical protein HK100_011735 [Physocladia obscura]|uniref:SDR family NAD(P)-dependent oxidoreductase n=1 Tax=Physocladia obscura TaxID=109957 RepID=A0AAD5T2H5_9FUNG|nr:hypothetical protein HK100_011735 [Physocladia obscura]
MTWLTEGRTVIITGGASGIGLALTRRIAQDGSKVVIVGRRQQVLDAVAAELSAKGLKVEAFRGDVTTPAERVALFSDLTTKYPEASVLINNAGVMKRVDLLGDEPWESVVTELDINLHAPIHLSTLFAKYWIAKKVAGVIASTTSGLAFVPLTITPVYCATKAGLHSFIWSLRRQLQSKNIKVIEIIPPAVDTDLMGPGGLSYGVNLEEFLNDIYAKLKNGDDEVGYQFSENLRVGYRNAVLETFESIN